MLRASTLANLEYCHNTTKQSDSESKFLFILRDFWNIISSYSDKKETLLIETQVTDVIKQC